MSEFTPYLAVEQLQGLESTPPNYEYEGLVLPHGIIVDALFGSHFDVAQMDELRTLLTQHDIVVHEHFDADEPTKKTLQKVANGDYKAREKMLGLVATGASDSVSNDDDLVAVIKALYNIKKPLLTIDPPAGHPITRKTHQNFARSHRFSTDFDTAVEQRGQQLQVEAETNLERESFMLKSFCVQVTDLVDKNPRFARMIDEGNPVRVLMFNFGLTHAGLFEGIREVARRSGFQLEGVARVVVGEDISLDYRSQAYGRFMRGLDIGRDMVARALVEGVLVNQRMLDSGGTLTQKRATSEAFHDLDTKSIDELHVIYDGVEAEVHPLFK